MNFFQLVICLFFTPLLLNAQVIHLVDDETSFPLEGVQLKGLSNNLTLKTDENGLIEINSLSQNNIIEIRYLGYQTIYKTYFELSQKEIVRMKLTGVSLDEVIISINRFEEKQDNIVQKIQVIRNRDLQNMNQSSMADVMANTGSVCVQKSQQGGGSPIIRGFETNKVLMVVDGIRMNNAIYRGGHLQNIITLDNAIMDRVELVFGPGSVIYGSDALGGVMHFSTKKPALADSNGLIVKGNAYARYQSACNGFSNHVDFSIGGKKMGSLSSITYSNFQDLRQGRIRNPNFENFGYRPWYVESINGVDSLVINLDSNLQVGSGYSQIDLLQKFLFKQSEKVTHQLNFQYSTSSNIPRYDRLTQLKNDSPKYADWYYGPQNRLLGSYHLTLKNTNFLYDVSQIIMGYQHILESRHTRKFQSNLLFSQLEQLNILTLNADFEKKAKNHLYRYGIDGWWNQVNSNGVVTDIILDTSAVSDSRYPDGGSVMHSAAIYATHNWEINDKFVLNEGVRLTSVGLNANFNNKDFFPFPFDEVQQQNLALNGNFGFIIKPSHSWRLTANIASGFRAPNVDDLGKVFESVPGSIIVPNPDLKPEKTYSGEIGISKIIEERIVLSTVGYYTLYKNALTVQPTQFQGQDSIWYAGEYSRVTSTVNSGEAFIYGLESRIVGNLNEFISLVGTVNYTYGRIKTDTIDYPLDHIPPVFGRIAVNVKKDKFRSEFFINYSGWKRLKDYNLIGEDNISFATPSGMPSWFTLNLRMTYEFLKKWSFQLACENILDQNYRVFASNISAPGRNFIVTLRFNF